MYSRQDLQCTVRKNMNSQGKTYLQHSDVAVGGSVELHDNRSPLTRCIIALDVLCANTLQLAQHFFPRKRLASVEV